MNQDLIIQFLNTAASSKIAWIQLNRPQSLNALTHAMCLQIQRALTQWAVDPAILAVVISSTSERAFCAGGDIRAIYQQGRDDLVGARQFFTDEYAMNRILYHFPKPYIALLDGVTMGGGMGVSIHGSHALATEKTQLAMPEARIGFYPDVGVSFHLARLPKRFGFYMGMTGLSVGPAEAVAMGLAKSMIAHSAKEAFLARLQTLVVDNPQNTKLAIEDCIKAFTVTPPSSTLLPYLDEIESCFSQPTVSAILAALAGNPHAWAQQAKVALEQNSPTSLVWTLRILTQAQAMTLDEVILRDMQLSHQFLTFPDLYEGVRAQLIDKDRQPRWQPVPFNL